MTMIDDEMEERALKAVEALEKHPSVVYANTIPEYDEVWCGIERNTTQVLEGVENKFGLVEPIAVFQENSEYGMILDVWWNLDSDYDMSLSDVDEWIEEHNYSEYGKLISEMIEDD